jgi:hypothetical protein
MKLLDRGLITQKSRDLFARSTNLTKIMNYLCIGNPMDWVHGWWTTAESHDPSWIGGGVDRRAPGRNGVLTGVGPPTTLGHGGSLVGVGNGEWSMGVPFWTSPRLEQRCGRRAMVMK